MLINPCRWRYVRCQRLTSHALGAPWLTMACKFLAALLIASGVHGFAYSAELLLTLRPDVLVDGPTYALTDIAEIAGENVDMASLGAVIGRSPLVGQIALYSRAELETVLQGRLLASGQRVAWAGAERVRIRRQGQLLDPAALVQLARDEVVKRFDADGIGMTVTLVTALPQLTAPAGTLNYTARLVDSSRLRSRMAVWVDVMAGDAIYRSVLVALAVTAPRDVLVARRALPAGGLAAMEDFSVQRVDVAALDDVALQQSALAGGGRMRQAVMAGQVLQSRHLTADGMILRGDRVQLKTAAGGIVVETTALAQADAVLGQQIRVRPERSSETVLARVTGAGMVSLEKR